MVLILSKILNCDVFKVLWQNFSAVLAYYCNVFLYKNDYTQSSSALYLCTQYCSWV